MLTEEGEFLTDKYLAQPAVYDTHWTRMMLWKEPDDDVQLELMPTLCLSTGEVVCGYCTRSCRCFLEDMEAAKLEGVRVTWTHQSWYGRR